MVEPPKKVAAIRKPREPRATSKKKAKPQRQDTSAKLGALFSPSNSLTKNPFGVSTSSNHGEPKKDPKLSAMPQINELTHHSEENSVSLS